MFNVSHVINDEGDLVQVPQPIMNDRDRFKPITTVILQYCAERGLSVYNPILTIDPTAPKDIISRVGFPVNIYSDNPLFHSHGVANAVFEKCTAYVSLTTHLPRREFELYVLGRTAARFYQYPNIKTIRAGQIMEHVRYNLPDYNGISILVLDPEIQLINIYHRLYRPQPKDWHESKHFEQILFGLLEKRYSKHGGETLEMDGVDGGSRDSSSTTRMVRQQLYKALPDAMPDAIIVGAWALKVLLDADPEWEKLQLLVETFEPDTLQERFNNMLGETDVRFSYDTVDVVILDDYWLRRCTFRINIDGKAMPVLDVFNSLEYEIVPYVERKGYRVGNPFVIARFLLIDRWVLALLRSIDKVPQDMYRRKAASVYRYLQRLRKLHDMCYGDQYSGTYKDLRVERQKFIREQEKYPRYEPQSYKHQHGHLRTFEK